MVNNGNTHLISIGANPINLDTHIAVEQNKYEDPVFVKDEPFKEKLTNLTNQILKTDNTTNKDLMRLFKKNEINDIKVKDKTFNQKNVNDIYFEGDPIQNTILQRDQLMIETHDEMIEFLKTISNNQALSVEQQRIFNEIKKFLVTLRKRVIVFQNYLIKIVFIILLQLF